MVLVLCRCLLFGLCWCLCRIGLCPCLVFVLVLVCDGVLVCVGVCVRVVFSFVGV